MPEPIQMLTHERPWREFADAKGVHYKTLRKHDSNDGVSLLLKFEPGARYHAHGHPGGEEYFVLQGVLNDKGKEWPEGSYLWHPPGSGHRPYSEQGCVLLVVLPMGIKLAGAQP